MPYPALPPEPPSIVITFDYRCSSTPRSPALSSPGSPSVEAIGSELFQPLTDASLLGTPLEIDLSPQPRDDRRTGDPASVRPGAIAPPEAIVETEFFDAPRPLPSTARNPGKTVKPRREIPAPDPSKIGQVLRKIPGEPHSLPHRSPGDFYRSLESVYTRQSGQSPQVANPAPTSPPAEVIPSQVVELRSNRQQYDTEARVVTAEGEVLMRFRGAILASDWLQMNLDSRIAVAEGDAIYTKGPQVLRGDRIEYDTVRNLGEVNVARGELFFPSAAQDFGPPLPTDVTSTALQDRALVDRLRAGQPPKRVLPGGGVFVGTGGGRQFGLPAIGGTLNRLRFEAERLNFNDEGWEGTNVRISNDPFSPPELEFRAEYARGRRLSPEQDEIVAKRGRLVFDQKVSIPIVRERVIIDRSDRDPSLIRFGYDREDRGGLYVESTVAPPLPGPFRLNLIPQYYLQRSLEEGTGTFDRLFGLKAKLQGNLTPTTTLTGSAVFTNFDFNGDEENPLDPNENDNFRGSLRLQQQLGGYRVSGEYSYRDRLFNGSLGYQTVQQSLGVVVTSPVIPLGKTGFNLSYQGSAQAIEADSDRLELLEPIRENNRIDLNRYQASASLSRGVLLWKGDSLPATPTQGLRYTNAPVVPYVSLFGGLTGVATAYSNDDTQNTLTGTIGIQGQFGHFSRPWLDYTGFNLGLSRVWQDGESPFLFDRIADSKVLSAGIVQQIYGPFRLGVQTSINLDTGERIGTDYRIEYSRRTYGVTLSYNPERAIGNLTLRISDFNWVSGGETFSSPEVRSVDGGVRR
ncbi:MAG: DUF3769 domain-containing protein [Cyanobacteria bacterium J007]|nr:MAG: DUF3769 domain-containing protein [Cyanobacteria bacterium J007]